MKSENEGLFNEITSEEEKMIWTYRPTLFTYLADHRELWYATGISFLFIVTFFVAEILTPERLVPWKFFTIFVVAVVLAMGYTILKRGLLHRHVGYGLSEKRVLIRSGLLAPTFKAIELSKITSVDVSRDLLQYFLGTGTIRITTNDDKFDELGLMEFSGEQLEGIKNPYGVLKEILKQRK